MIFSFIYLISHSIEKKGESLSSQDESRLVISQNVGLLIAQSFGFCGKNSEIIWK